MGEFRVSFNCSQRVSRSDEGPGRDEATSQMPIPSAPGYQPTLVAKAGQREWGDRCRLPPEGASRGAGTNQDMYVDGVTGRQSPSSSSSSAGPAGHLTAGSSSSSSASTIVSKRPQQQQRTPTGKKRRPLCAKCKNHGNPVEKARHKKICPYDNCTCRPCRVTSDRQRVMKNQQRLRRAPQPPPEALHNALISVHSNGSSPGPDPDPQQILDVLKDFPHPPNSGKRFPNFLSFLLGILRLPYSNSARNVVGS